MMIRILVVEDQEDLRGVMRDLLTGPATLTIGVSIVLGRKCYWLARLRLRPTRCIAAERITGYPVDMSGLRPSLHGQALDYGSLKLDGPRTRGQPEPAMTIVSTNPA
jgi:hypothetical protein